MTGLLLQKPGSIFSLEWGRSIVTDLHLKAITYYQYSALLFTHLMSIMWKDAFSRPWSVGKSWCHPAPRNVGAVIQKVKEEAVTAALLLPTQTGSWWWRKTFFVT